MFSNEFSFDDLKGKTFTKVVLSRGNEKYNNNYLEKDGGINYTLEGVGTRDKILFESDGYKYILVGQKDCCNFVFIEDICGDLSDIENSKILLAEESFSGEGSRESGDSKTWSFYKLSTINGSVTIRFNGESNGYYSETADLLKMHEALDYKYFHQFLRESHPDFKEEIKEKKPSYTVYEPLTKEQLQKFIYRPTLFSPEPEEANITFIVETKEQEYERHCRIWPKDQIFELPRNSPPYYGVITNDLWKENLPKKEDNE